MTKGSFRIFGHQAALKARAKLLVDQQTLHKEIEYIQAQYLSIADLGSVIMNQHFTLGNVDSFTVKFPVQRSLHLVNAKRHHH